METKSIYLQNEAIFFSRWVTVWRECMYASCVSVSGKSEDVRGKAKDDYEGCFLELPTTVEASKQASTTVCDARRAEARWRLWVVVVSTVPTSML